MKVYLIGSSEGFCKIGVARSPDYRLYQLDATKLPFELTLLAEHDTGVAAHYVERRLHKHFKDRHVRGEWFRMVPVQEFLRKAKEFCVDYVPPKPRAPGPNPFAGTPWGVMSGEQRCKFLRSVAKLPDDIQEELHVYAHSQVAPENMNELLYIIRLGLESNHEVQAERHQTESI